ncbi:hypothetical protein DYQ86_15600 [Acidobacteria bacterium AB60]|nr:hypothetical protein DYQ86_15600 [Acidobacteria bacterium AB60]
MDRDRTLAELNQAIAELSGSSEMAKYALAFDRDRLRSAVQAELTRLLFDGEISGNREAGENGSTHPAVLELIDWYLVEAVDGIKCASA